MTQKSRHLWHPWLRVQRVLRAMLTERWDRRAWQQIRREIPKVLAEQRRLKRHGWFIHENVARVK